MRFDKISSVDSLLRVFTEMLNQFRILVRGLKSIMNIDIYLKSKIKKNMSHPSKALTKFWAVPTYFNLVWIQKKCFGNSDFSFLNPFCCPVDK